MPSERDVEYDPETAEPMLLAFLRGYWDERRSARAMPSRKDVVPSQMRAQLPHVLLADVIAGGDDFRYRLVGGELQRYFHGNPTGRLMSEALAPFGPDTVSRTIQTYATVVARKAPMRIRGSGVLYSQDAKLFDALLAPLSDDGETPNMILGTFSFVWKHAVSRMPVVEPNERMLARALKPM